MDNIFLFVVGIFMIVFYANRGGDRENVEGFNDIGKMTITDLQNLIYSTYKADVQAIKNLADTAAKLQAGGLTVPGNLNVSGNTNVNGNITGPTVNSINKSIKDAIDSLTNTINAKYTELNNKINTINTTLNNKINSINTNLSNAINTKVTKDAWFSFKGYRNHSVGDVQPVRIGWNWTLQCNGGERHGDLFQINQ